jgi:DnaJ-domain-containing protein 1
MRSRATLIGAGIGWGLGYGIGSLVVKGGRDYSADPELMLYLLLLLVVGGVVTFLPGEGGQGVAFVAGPLSFVVGLASLGVTVGLFSEIHRVDFYNSYVTWTGGGIPKAVLGIPFAAYGAATGYEIAARVARGKEERERRLREEEEKRRIRQQQEEIAEVTYQLQAMIQAAMNKAVGHTNSVWLSALKILEGQVQELSAEFHKGMLSYADAKSRIAGLMDHAKTLERPPMGEPHGLKKEAPQETFYDILGVSPNATSEEIKRAYRGKAREYHSDLFMRQPRWVQEHAEEMMKKINEAYETLTGAMSRRKYDREHERRKH